MKLYYYPLSPYSQKVQIAFNEKGIRYIPEIIDMTSTEARADYAKISPLGKVPLFKPSEDWSVPESTSIIEYLEDKFPDSPRLIAIDGADGPRQVRFVDRMSDLYYNDPVVELLFQQIGLRGKDEDKATRARRHVTMMHEHWNRRLASQTWLCGEQFTMADCAAIPAMYYAQFAAPFDGHANVMAYWARAQQRPSYLKVREEFEPLWRGLMAKNAA